MGGTRPHSRGELTRAAQNRAPHRRVAPWEDASTPRPLAVVSWGATAVLVMGWAKRKYDATPSATPATPNDTPSHPRCVFAELTSDSACARLDELAMQP